MNRFVPSFLYLQEVYVEGIVRGNVFATDVKIKKNGMLLGDIQCTYLTLDPTASIKVRLLFFR